MKRLPEKVSAVTPLGGALDGTAERRKGRGKDRGPRRSGTLNYEVTVDPRVMAAARRAMLPGQRLVIVDAECVMLVNS